MSQQVQTTRHRPLAASAARNSASASLCSVVYRSVALSPLSSYELYELVQSAQSRNRAHSITGLMLYDNARFYQWLEGPPADVARLMNAITRDSRHTNIEILSDKPINARQFGSWTMRLATRGARSIHSRHNVTTPSAETFDDLLRRPDHVPAILAGFSPGQPTRQPAREASARPAPAKRRSNGPLQGPAAAMLKSVILTTVLPELMARHAIEPRGGPFPIDTRARALADLLIGPDNGAALDLIRALQGDDSSVRHLYKSLVEPAARRLGDLWGADLCTEFDVTLGLGQLQRAVRVLNEDSAPAISNSAFLPAVLIIPEPGQLHSLAANLDGDVLWNAGWDPQNEFPTTDEALQDLVAGTWFDAMDLSLSASFRQDHWLPRVTKTIALARHASRNPAMAVIVAGRIFAEDDAASTQVGADGSSETAMGTEQTIRDTIRRTQTA